jgi:hypothetical protein
VGKICVLCSTEAGKGVAMSGDDEICGSLFSYTRLENRVRADHPLRVIREIPKAALAANSRSYIRRSGAARSRRSG